MLQLPKVCGSCQSVECELPSGEGSAQEREICIIAQAVLYNIILFTIVVRVLPTLLGSSNRGIQNIPPTQKFNTRWQQPIVGEIT